MALSFDFSSHAEGKIAGVFHPYMAPDEPMVIPVAYDSFAVEFPYIPGFNYSQEKIRYSVGNSEIEFCVCHYFAMRAAYQGKEFLLDGRDAPYDNCWQGEYLEGRVSVTEVTYTEKDLETGEVRETRVMESVPGIVHDLEKEFGPEIKRPRDE